MVYSQRDMIRSAAVKPCRSRRFSPLLLLCIALLLASTRSYADEQQNSAPEPGLAPILKYISTGWDTLTRSMTDCQTVVDPKLTEASVLYLPADFAAPPTVKELQKRCKIHVEPLPAVITTPGQIDPSKMPPGLLYLEHKYVVPGGRFNEMYGWDSYFIILGLVRDGRIDLARGMVENFFFEIDHYGTILNANRAYYLTRSQPPFLTSMIMAVYDAEKAAGHEDRGWLERAYGFASEDYESWNREPHTAGSTGLSRYYDFGNGPAPESLKDEAGSYRKVAGYFLLHPQAQNYVAENTSGADPGIGFQYAVQICDAPNTMAKPDCEPARKISLSPDYYKGDRSMRESGFDISFRFGPYGAATHHYAPICLNSLLYKTEKDLERISTILGKPADARRWRIAAAERQARINKYLWDARRGLFFDYDFTTGTRSAYEYATTFYPLWAGLASPQQAAAVARHLALFEQNGGLAMSRRESQAQWDYPYGWAPVHLLAVEGLRRYGYAAAAARISSKFLNTVLRNFQADGTIREKYDVVRASEITHISAGYAQNVIGFGWTNGVFLELWRQLPPALRAISPQSH
jgi:alpha,alpha-trehalase